MAGEDSIQLAQAYIPLVPSMRGIGSNIQRELSAAALPAARSVGADMGRMMGTSLSAGTSKSVSGAFKNLGAGLAKDFGAGFNLAGPLQAQERKVLASAKNISSGFVAGFKSADAAASSFTGRVGTLGGKVRSSVDLAGKPLFNLVGGFRDADAAASAFSGRMGTLGGKTRSAFEAAAQPSRNFVSGFKDADAAASAFSGRMGTLGGKVSAGLNTAIQPTRNFVSGFKDADAAASTFSGRMGTLGGKVATGMNVAAKPVNFLADKFGTLQVKAKGVFEQGVTGARNFKAGLEDTRAAVNPLTGRLGTIGGAVGKLSGRFSTFRTDFKQAFTGAEKDAKDSFDDIERYADKAGRETGGKFSAGLKTAMGAVGVYLGADAIFGGFKSALTGAGDLEQSVGAMNTVFAGSEAKMMQWSNTATTAVGLSKNSYNEFATLIGSQMKNAGVPMDQLADKTNTMIGLGADLASMYGGTTADAIDAISSALKGEMDPIERYGISLNESALEAEALAMGIEKTGGAFTNQQKQMLVSSLLFKQSADAQGNFNREQDTYAHKLQVASAEWENLSAKIGELFLPVATRVMGWAGDTLIPVFEEIVGGITAFGAAWTAADGDITSSGFPGFMEETAYKARQFYDAFMGTMDIWGPFAAGIGIVVGAFMLYRTAMAITTGVQTAFAIGLGIVTAAEVGATGATAALGGAIAFLTSPITLTIAAIGLFVGALILAYNKVGWFRDLVNTAWAWIQQTIANFVTWWTATAWPAIQTGLEVIGQWFVALWQNYAVPAFNGLVAVAQWAWTTIIIPLFNTVVSVIRDFLAPIFVWLWQTIITPVFNGIVSVAQWAWTTIIVPLFTMVVAVVRDILAPIFMWLWRNIITPAFNGIVGIIKWAWNNIIQPIFTAIVWTLQNIVGPVFTWLWKNIVQPAFTGIRIIIEVAWKLIEAIFWALHALLTDVIGPVFNWLWEKVVKPVFTWISDKISDTWYWLRDNIFKPFGEYLTGPFMDFWTKTRDGIGEIWDGIKDIVKKPIKFVVDTVINDGLIGGYNKLNDFWNGPDIDRINLGFARGGVIPGYQSAKRDDVLTPMRRGEGVLVPEATRAVGHNFIHGLNGAANSGGTSGATNWLARNFGQGYATGGVISPLKQRFPISQGYNRIHKGIDIAAPIGTPIYATADGRVSHAGPGARAPGVWGGNEIHVASGGIERWFAHLSEIAVSVGQMVKKGDYLGKTGNTGISSGPHLHFGVFNGGWPNDINPLDYLGGAVNFDSSDTSGGGGVIDFVLGKFADIITAPVKKVREMFPGNGFVDAGVGVAEKAVDQLKDFAVEQATSILGFDFGSGGNNNGGGGGNVDQYRDLAKKALEMEGVYSEGNLNSLMRRMNQESGGNPRAVNNWDINAVNGNNSRGLMQVIPTTFAANARPGYDKDIFDPLSNILASIRYTMRRYPSLQAGWDQPGGYRFGGIVAEPALYDNGGWLTNTGKAQLIQHKRRDPDAVLTSKQWADISALAEMGAQQVARGTQFGDVHFSINQDPERTAEQTVRRATEEFLWTMEGAL